MIFWKDISTSLQIFEALQSVSSSSFLGFFFASWPKQMNCYLVWDVQMPCLPHSTLGNEGDGVHGRNNIHTMQSGLGIDWLVSKWLARSVGKFSEESFLLSSAISLARVASTTKPSNRSMIVPGCKGWHLRIDIWKHRNFRNSLRNCE